MRYIICILVCCSYLMVPKVQAEPRLWGPEHVAGKVDTAWYVEPMVRYANYITNAELLAADNIAPDKASQYLYDRPRALFQLYLLTGNKKWRAQAINASQYYIAHLNDDGYFSLIENKDIKYSMPRGLFYYYQLTGNTEAKDAIGRIYTASLNWKPSYSGQGFWTERNQAAALEAALTYYELTEDKAAQQRVETILAATLKMTMQPEANWPQRGCPQHSFKSHEGGADQSAVCSPWMLALLADPIWRYSQITDSKTAIQLLQQFGRFIVEHGTYVGTNKFSGQYLPKYLVVFDNKQMEDINPWNDVQHSCDVAALLGKALYVSDTISKHEKTVFLSLLEPCKSKSNKLNDNKLYWQVRPARKFGWEYSTTSDLPWLELAILRR